MNRALPAAAVALALAASPVDAASLSSPDDAAVHSLLTALDRQDGCGETTMDLLRLAGRQALDQVASDSEAEPPDIAELMAAGILVLDVGDAAAKHGCPVASRLYEYVIQVYVGVIYGGLRERAMLGLSRLEGRG